MRNNYAGTCYRCGCRVEAGAGHFEKVSRSHRKKWPNMAYGVKWLTQHAECAIRFRGTDRHFQHAPDVQPWPVEPADA